MLNRRRVKTDDGCLLFATSIPALSAENFRLGEDFELYNPKTGEWRLKIVTRIVDNQDGRCRLDLSF
ncbi:hypothetical protein AAFN85_02940 [Mucilaginibacter sp. CAU 1740]|uniref:hypothetical protein n=1 Tax=Mucilaginibacter sp. CAU 1740 TaxID=3140365 RepID=UPI00325B0560